jgi:hypothetical protein
MSVVNINTAKGLGRSGNTRQQILRLVSSPAQLFQFPNTVKDEGFVLKTSPLSLKSPALVRKPIRLIVARTLVSYTDHWHTGHYFLDTLTCGHQVHSYSFEAEKKRRGCHECLEALAVPSRRAA